MITKEDIVFSLECMGIKKGDILLLHSALTAIGKVDGGAETVIDAFLETIGEEGTLVMSTLTGWFAPFDAKTSPSIVGYLSEAFRHRKGVLRSLHPVHSVAAYGKYAEYITKDHDKCETGCGEGTPYLKIAELGGKAMLLGVDMDRNTTMHSMEEAIDAKYLLTLDIPAPTYIDGYKNKKFTLKKFPPGHRDFLAMTPYLRKNDLMNEGKIGNALVKVIDVKGMFDLGKSMMEKNPLLFICENENCNSCHWSRLLYTNEKIDYSRYKRIQCHDPHCEVCVVEEQ
ncbi:MAG: AAC(3) family N-acetyltransferase [Clostridia bacterium]|nr:AAC(3) family N-acetyltransferase [Clostridia bacterium]